MLENHGVMSQRGVVKDRNEPGETTGRRQKASLWANKEEAKCANGAVRHERCVHTLNNTRLINAARTSECTISLELL